MTELDLQEWWDSTHKTNNKVVDKKLLKMALFTLTLTILGDLVGSFDNYAMVHDWFWVQMLTGMVNQTTWLVISFLFICADDKKTRIVIGISQGLGASIGSSIMLGFIKPNFLKLLEYYDFM
jgi:hypothetical protein